MRMGCDRDESKPSTNISVDWAGLKEALSCKVSIGTLMSNAVIEQGRPVYSARVVSRVYKANHVMDLVAFSESLIDPVVTRN